jgi:hypothetical protein
MSNQEAVAQIKTGCRMKAPEGCPPQIADMMMACWSAQAEDRPTFSQLLRQLQDLLETAAQLQIPSVPPVYFDSHYSE